MKCVKKIFDWSIIGFVGMLVLLSGLESVPKATNSKPTHSATDSMAMRELVLRTTFTRPISQAEKAHQAEAQLSDGRFNLLNTGWKRTVIRTIKTGRCDQYDSILWKESGRNRELFWVLKAQMLTESFCQADVVGKDEDLGLFQVLKPTCNMEVAVFGNLFNPQKNIECALKYHKKLCERYGKCTTLDRLVAYNRGPNGSAQYSWGSKRSLEYIRKVHFALWALAQGEIMM